MLRDRLHEGRRYFLVDIDTSADAFHDHYDSISLTTAEWLKKWRQWCRREKRFARRVVPTSAANEGTPTSRTAADRNRELRLRIEVKALELWLAGVSWDHQLGPEPKSKADAQTCVARLESEIFEAFHASAPSSLSMESTEQTVQGVTSCG